MNISRSFLLIFFTFLSSVLVTAQDSHVHTRYVKDINKTIVETDLMYLNNTPQQFVQLGFVTRYPGEQMNKAPDKIDLLIWSFSREVMYKNRKDLTLMFSTDGESWSTGKLNYLVSRGETKNGQDIFWSDKRPDLGQPSPLPKGALVKDTQGINNLFMEQIFAELKPEQLLKIANAQRVEMRLG